ncbi:MAG: 30S ribosomal protein S3 [Thermoplasmatales archaeon]|nr:MAG: 30S ribosomal protein S3 [Thermoplasmatales archaeon]
MATERKFIRENTKRSLIKKFLLKEIEGAGFGSMSIQRTPIGTRVNILVERPGMVIGKAGSKIKDLTENIQRKFDIDNPQIEIQEAGATAPLNAQIMAEKLAEALERGWHFRRAGHSTVRRIMNAGAKGCQITIAGKLTGARHRTEKFTEGHVKYCGEIAKAVMNEGFATAKLKAGVLGVKVRIMKPDAKLPDEIKLKTREEEKVKTEGRIEKPEAKPIKKTDIKKLTKIQGIGSSVVKKLEKAKIKSLEELYEMDIDSMVSIEGIGKKTAEIIIKKLKKLIEEGN